MATSTSKSAQAGTTFSMGASAARGIRGSSASSARTRSNSRQREQNAEEVTRGETTSVHDEQGFTYSRTFSESASRLSTSETIRSPDGASSEFNLWESKDGKSAGIDFTNRDPSGNSHGWQASGTKEQVEALQGQLLGPESREGQTGAEIWKAFENKGEALTAAANLEGMRVSEFAGGTAGMTQEGSVGQARTSSSSSSESTKDSVLAGGGTDGTHSESHGSGRTAAGMSGRAGVSAGLSSSSNDRFNNLTDSISHTDGTSMAAAIGRGGQGDKGGLDHTSQGSTHTESYGVSRSASVKMTDDLSGSTSSGTKFDQTESGGTSRSSSTGINASSDSSVSTSTSLSKSASRESGTGNDRANNLTDSISNTDSFSTTASVDGGGVGGKEGLNSTKSGSISTDREGSASDSVSNANSVSIESRSEGYTDEKGYQHFRSVSESGNKSWSSELVRDNGGASRELRTTRDAEADTVAMSYHDIGADGLAKQWSATGSSDAMARVTAFANVANTSEQNPDASAGEHAWDRLDAKAAALREQILEHGLELTEQGQASKSFLDRIGEQMSGAQDWLQSTFDTSGLAERARSMLDGLRDRLTPDADAQAQAPDGVALASAESSDLSLTRPVGNLDNVPLQAGSEQNLDSPREAAQQSPEDRQVAENIRLASAESSDLSQPVVGNEDAYQALRGYVGDVLSATEKAWDNLGDQVNALRERAGETARDVMALLDARETTDVEQFAQTAANLSEKYNWPPEALDSPASAMAALEETLSQEAARLQEDVAAADAQLRTQEQDLEVDNTAEVEAEAEMAAD